MKNKRLLTFSVFLSFVEVLPMYYYVMEINTLSTLDKCIISNKTHNKNIKNIHILRTITNPGIHSPPSYVALSRDARTAYATTRYDIAYHLYPWQYSRNIY